MGSSEFRDGWTVVVAGFFVCFMVDGLVYSFGIFLVEFIDAFDETRVSTALVGAIGFGAKCLFGPITGSLADTFGSRFLTIIGSLLCFTGFFASSFAKSLLSLYFTYGLIGGMGMCFMWLPANACVIKHFTKRRALACGISICGSGLGTFAYSKMVDTLITEYGWKMTLLITSAILLNGIPCGLLLVPPKTTISKHENIQLDQDSDKPTHKERLKLAIQSVLHVFKNMLQDNILLLKDRTCFIIMLSGFFVSMAFLVPFSLLPDQVRQDGLSKSDASWLVSSIGICNITGRLLFGWIGDKVSKNRRLMLETMVSLQVISIGTMPVLPTFETKFIATCVFGLGFGGYIILLPVVLADEFGPEKIGKSFGLILFTFGVASLLGTPFAGWIYDVSNNYNLSFYVAGGECCIGLICLVVLRIRHLFNTTDGMVTASTQL